MCRSHHLLAVLLGFVFLTTGCPKDDEKKKDDKSEEKSSKKKADDSDDDEEKPKKKKKADDDEDEEKTEKKTKKSDDDAEEIPKVGVKACDDYIDKMQKCFKAMKKVPPEAAATQKKGLVTMAKAWKDATSKGEPAKKGIKDGCEMATKAAISAYKAQCPGVLDE